MTHDQEVVWIPKGAPQKRVARVERRPKKVWTLRGKHDPKKKPSLPIIPHVGMGAFPEDVGHDWAWRGGVLRYFSRLNDGGVWVLLEF